MKYPICHEIDILESLPTDSVVRLQGWALAKLLGLVFLLDGTGGKIRILDLPVDLMNRIPPEGAGPLIGVDLHVRVVQLEQGYFQWATTRTEVYHYTPEKARCTCGAQHTQYKDRHYTWCDASMDDK